MQGYIAYQYNVYSYFPLLLTNQWPPDNNHPVEVEADEPLELSRMMLLFLKLPSFLLEIIASLSGFVCLFPFILSIPVWWIILVIGRYPRAAFDLGRSILEWSCGITAWHYLLRDDGSLFGTTTPVKVPSQLL